MSGRSNYLEGLSAEDAVARAYVRLGHSLEAWRWRGTRGEIDLIFRCGEAYVFVEVKKSRDFRRAAEALASAQLDRICQTAVEYLSKRPNGMQADMRFDLAMVDRSGQIERLENITL
ncbi:YraN family protein [Maritimibacter dapengensis]|uniref:YraN family protein n=1 Tax=Maritimibacter dapengensis TaxID=2836868 RepID=A0ABS6T7X9_9RHOB|nr:YraN family protein [Maritimibacter dapengensis]MBV7380656.1 YraN family protein [Maritimibacter dapengensis]